MYSKQYINCSISHEIHQYLFSWAYILVLLLGVPANVFSLYHAVLQLKVRNELGVYLLQLTLSDLLYLASLPLWLQYIFEGDDWRNTEWLCQVCGFLLYQNIYISVGFLCCISIDRYLAVVYPLRFTALRSMKAAAVASVAIWLKEIAVGVVFFHHRELSTDRTNQSVCFEHYPMQLWEHPINYYRFIVGFLFPLAILALSYLRVLKAVGKSAGTQNAQKQRIKQLVTSTVVIFMLCFFPYHVFLLVRTLLEKDCDFIVSIFNYYHFSLLLTSFNCIADPVLYCFVSEAAQRSLQGALSSTARVLCCCCGRQGGASPAQPQISDSNEVAASNENGAVVVVTLLHSTNVEM
ncbi:ovarian cancer G-protein coupled receptor 1 [Osmerus mordax]|uniref:ovarian cancer G-protein coupled receptor 1 n=1 Tax=Osmerus mordax TaxID=8014 RepID=UPI00350FF4FA